MDRLLDQINQDKAMGRGGGISKTAARHWEMANVASGMILRLKRIKSTDTRPLMARLRKKFRRTF